VLGETTRNRREERREATRAEIVSVAWEVAREHGLAGLSLRDLARRVGMSAPSMYSYFDSKHAIYDAMFAEGAQAYLEYATSRERTGDPLRDLQLGMRDFVDFCTSDPVRYQLLFQRTIPGFEPSPETYEISVKGLALVRDHLHEIGITDPKALDLLTAIGNGLADQQISNDPGGDRWSRLTEEAMEMLYVHMKHQQATTTTKKRGTTR
jgi:AcrR family transcriptional regulator